MDIKNESKAAIVRQYLYGGTVNINDFIYENLQAPPLLWFMTPQHIMDLNHIATSIKYSGNSAKKIHMIHEILAPLGFRQLSGGTNRVVYRHLEVPNIVIKVAYDKVGLQDNPSEFKNQSLLQPFCTKVFETSPNGTVGLFERVTPVRSVEEYSLIKDSVRLMIREKMIMRGLIAADIGEKFFMNWGVRDGFGPVILDFPYVYNLDGGKIYCTKEMPNGSICGGEIDYDHAYNFLYCTKCGKRYMASDLAKKGSSHVKKNGILIIGKRGGVKMKVGVKDATGKFHIVSDTTEDNPVMTKNERPKRRRWSDYTPEKSVPVVRATSDAGSVTSKPSEKPEKIDTVSRYGRAVVTHNPTQEELHDFGVNMSVDTHVKAKVHVDEYDIGEKITNVIVGASKAKDLNAYLDKIDGGEKTSEQKFDPKGFNFKRKRTTATEGTDYHYEGETSDDKKPATSTPFAGINIDSGNNESESKDTTSTTEVVKEEKNVTSENNNSEEVNDMLNSNY